jgi:hypothetical protein
MVPHEFIIVIPEGDVRIAIGVVEIPLPPRIGRKRPMEHGREQLRDLGNPWEVVFGT